MQDFETTKYAFGTQANRIFMAEQTKQLLDFAKNFPAPIGGSSFITCWIQ